MSEPTVGSLFSGIGGLDLGLERAGFRVIWQCEADPFARRVLAKRWPGIPCYEDVRNIDESVERPDVLCGGFPCQDVSLAGKRRGLAGKRSGLWSEFARIIRLLRPRVVLVENVPGLLSAGFGQVLGDLAEIGFDAEWDVLSAAAVGAPHRRERVFVVAVADGPGVPFGEILGGQLQDAGWPGPAQTGDVPNPDLPRLAVGSCFGCDARQELAAFERANREGDGVWATEPDVGRVASRLSIGMDGGLSAHPECIEKAGAAGVPETVRLRALRLYLESPEASSRPSRCRLCGHPLSSLPCRGACAPWHVGPGPEEAENVRCLREGVLELLARRGEDVQPLLSLGGWASQRTQAVGSRIDRLRCLGNAVVPQDAEWLGRRIRRFFN